MRTLATAVVVCLVALGGCVSLPPDGPKPDPGPAPSAAEAERVGVAAVKPYLKDPDSIKDIEVRVSKTGWVDNAGKWDSGWQVCFAYNAKNSYGAYAGRTVKQLILRCTAPDRCWDYSNGGRWMETIC